MNLTLLESLLEYGYLGTFTISILGNLVPFLPVPYLIPIFLLSHILEPFFVGITVGIGASLGKCVSYAIGRGGRAVLDEKKKKELECFGNLLGKYGVIAVYLFSSLPLPDDIIVMPFGIIKYNFKRFFVALLLGKLTLGMIVAYTAKYSFEYAKIFIGNGDPLLTIAVSVTFMLLMTWVIYKINWIEATQYIEKNGVIAYIKFMLRKKSK
ncbi:MAG: VTT domain-containing protein [Candidatus Methanomethyliaceae archaeon]|nr:VTT domain-containing protein [Candidatus Methanomethyliaceae archaeon]